MPKKTTKKKAAKKARLQRTNLEPAKPEAKPPAKKARRGKSSQDRLVARFKRSVNCPHHLTRLGRKPTKAERDKLDAGLVPQRRFNGGRQYTMTREELSRYCLKEKLDYIVERVIPATSPPSSPEGGGSNPTPPENPDAGQTHTDPSSPPDEQSAEPPPAEGPADPGPGDQAGADEQPPPVDPAAAQFIRPPLNHPTHQGPHHAARQDENRQGRPQEGPARSRDRRGARCRWRRALPRLRAPGHVLRRHAVRLGAGGHEGRAAARQHHHGQEEQEDLLEVKPRLAQIEVLTARLDGKGDPTVVADVLEAATARAEEQAGRELCRATRTEYPYPVDVSRELQLRVRPVESVTSIVQLSSPGSEADFDAADALAEFTDFYVDDRTGIVEHQNGYWQARRGLVRVTYIGGYLDPDGIADTLSGAVNTGATQFDVGVAVAVGDEVVFTTTGERVTVGEYAAGTVTIAAGGALVNDYADGVAIAHYPGDAVLPPNHLQEGVIQQAIWFYNTADTAGIQQVDFGEAGGQISYGQVKTHPHLITSVQKLPGRRLP